MICDPSRQNIKKTVVDGLLNDIDEGSNKALFLVFGRPQPWDDDASPPEGTDSVSTEEDFWRNAVGAKRVSGSDISLVIPRYDWVSGQVYRAYRDDEDLFDDANPAQFFVFVDNERVYKCIDNLGGTQSTVKPTGTNTNVIQTGDGYRWKYMYTVTEDDRKFVSSVHIPVFKSGDIVQFPQKQPQSSVEDAAVDGAIDFVEVTRTGDDYLYVEPDNPENIITSVVSTTQATVPSDFSEIDGSYVNYTMKITAPQGSGRQELLGQQRKIVSYDASTKTVGFESPFTVGLTLGDQFSIIPTAIITGGGTGAILEVKIDSSTRQVSSVEVANRGSGYNYASVTVLPDPPLGRNFGTGTGGESTTARVVLSPPGGHGKDAPKELGASELTVYSEISASETGILDISNEFRQIGIISNPLLFGGATIAGQEGAFVTRLLVESKTGSNLTQETFIDGERVLGLSSGAYGLVQTGGWNPVSGDITRGFLNVLNIQGTFLADPSGGETLLRLNSDWLAVTQAIDSGVKVRAFNSFFQGVPDAYRQTVKLGITTASDTLTETTFTEDATIFGKSSGASGVVVSWDFANLDLYLTRLDGVFTTEDIAIGVTSSSLAEILTVERESLETSSGDLLYIQNLKPLQRDSEQREEIRITFSF